MKKILFPIMALIAYAGMAKAQNALSVADVTLPQNSEATLTVSFQFDAADTYTGYSFNLELPSDLEFVMDEGTDVAYVKGGCHDASHSVTANLDEGLVKVAGLSLSSKPLSGTSGVLLTFTIRPKSTLAIAREFTGSIKDILLVPIEGTKKSLDASNFSVTIGEPVELRTILDESSTTTPEAAADVDVRVRRTINAGNWSTICLPFEMTAAQVTEAFGNDVELAEFEGVETTFDGEDNVVALTINFSNVAEPAIEANHPYIIKVSNMVTEFTVDGVTINPEEARVNCNELRLGSGTLKDPYRYLYNSFVGTYVANTTLEAMQLFLNGNKFWYSDGTKKMKGYRAYFEFYDVLTDVENAYSAVKMAINFDGEETIVEGIRSATDNSNIYDLSGRKIKSPKHHGVYILDGKKVFVK